MPKEKRWIRKSGVIHDRKRLEPDRHDIEIRLPRDASEVESFRKAGGVEAITDGLESAKRAYTLPNALALIEAEARKAWRTAGDLPEIGEVTSSLTGLVTERPYSPEWYAAEMLERIATIRKMLAHGRSDIAVIEALRLGGSYAEHRYRGLIGERHRSDGAKAERRTNAGRDAKLIALAISLKDGAANDEAVRSLTALARLVRTRYNSKPERFGGEKQLSLARVRSLLTKAGIKISRL